MSAPADRNKLEAICQAALEAVGYDVVELEYAREPQGWVLRVFIDHPHTTRAERGVAPPRITHEDCGVASRHLGTVLDVEDPIGSNYNLEVSSPGVMRPLRYARDFRRFIGFQVRVRLAEALEGRKNFAGELVAAGDDEMTVDDGQARFTLPLAAIAKARLDEEY